MNWRSKRLSPVQGEKDNHRLLMPTSDLNHAAVNTEWCHVARLIEEPKSFPFLNQGPEVFRCVDHLLSSFGWIG